MVELENVDTKDNYNFTSLAKLHQHIKSKRPDHDRWEFLRSEEHLDYKFDGDPIYYFSDEKLVNDVYTYELWAKSYAVASTIRHKSVRDKFLKGKEVLIPGMVAHVHLMEFTSLYASFLRSNDETLHQMLSCDFSSDVFAALMFLFHMWGLMFPLAMAQRWELKPNRVLQSLDFLNHSSWELEQTISFVLICCFVCVPSFAKEEAYTLSNIQGKLLYSWYMEIDESVFNNLVLLCSFSVLCRDFHCTSVAVLMTVTKLFKILAPRYHCVNLLQWTVFAFLLQQLGLESLLGIFDDLNIFRVTGEVRMWILPPLLTDDASGGENENTVDVDFHKGQHEMTEMAVMDRIYEVVSFKGRPALFLPWFSGKLVMTGFGDVLFSEFIRIARLSHHHPIFDLIIDKKNFVDSEKYKLNIKWELLTYIAISMVDVLDGKEVSMLLWPPGTLKVRVLLPCPLMISPVVFRICLVAVTVIINTEAGVGYEVFQKEKDVVLCTKYGSHSTSTTPMERTDVTCDSSNWVICSIFHHVVLLVHGAVAFGSPSCIQLSLLLREILKDTAQFIDTRSKMLMALAAVNPILVQLCLVRPTCLCCFLQDLTNLMDYNFSLGDVMHVPTYIDHIFCYLSTREDFFQGESLFSCALWNHNLVFSNIYNDAHVCPRELAIHNGDNIHLVHVKKSICVAYHVRCFLFHRGNRILFMIMERMFSLERPSWSSLALGSVYLTIHLFPFASSLHELRHGVFTKEFDIVSLELIDAGSERMDVAESSTLVHVHSSIFQVALHENIIFCAFMSAFMLLCDCFHVNDVSGLIPRGLLVFGVSPDFTRNSVQAMEFVVFFSHIHGHLLDHLKGSYDRYKAAAGWRRRDLQFYLGAYVWALLTKEFSVSGSYDHLEVGIINSLEVTWEDKYMGDT